MPTGDASVKAGAEVQVPLKFCNPERLALLRTPGLGPKVVSRLEEQGLTSIEAMRELGVERVVEMVCSAVGSNAWKNRHAALSRALDSSAAGRRSESKPVPGPT